MSIESDVGCCGRSSVGAYRDEEIIGVFGWNFFLGGRTNRKSEVKVAVGVAVSGIRRDT
jgi:hypothetical protein